MDNSIASCINSSEEDMKAVYLYNVCTGNYLNIGSNWDTSVSAYNVGMLTILAAQGGNTYRIQGSLTTSDATTLDSPIRQILPPKPTSPTGSESTATIGPITLILLGLLANPPATARR